MSKSRSPSPIPGPAVPHKFSFPSSTTSRPQLPVERQTSKSPPTPKYIEPLTVRLSPPPPLPLESQLPESSSGKRRSSHPTRLTNPSSGEPMAKRIRGESPQIGRTRHRNRSSPESDDSQDDMADNEMEVGKITTPGSLPPTSVPPKKKRTRTLTTPHQSAVLHALLAQSRFPTTAVREEVGRSIGLSARKVQIWFQNQRQKARRPQTQSDAHSSRPPQFGPFPSGSQLAPHEFEEHRDNRMLYPFQGGHPSEIPPSLLGPGMPGAPLYPPPTYAQMRTPVSAPPTGTRFQTEHGYPIRNLSPRPYSSRADYVPRTRPGSGFRERDPSRTLPPLESTMHLTSTSYNPRRMHLPRPGVPLFPPPRAPPAYVQRSSISPEPRFAHQLPEPYTRPRVSIPPPFTLQPSPQWDEQSYGNFPTPGSSTWARPGSQSATSRQRSTSPVIARRDAGGTRQTSDTYYLAEHMPIRHPSPPRSIPPTTPPLRSGRYDPVRATFVPYSTSVVSPPEPPESTMGSRDDERADQNIPPFHEDR